MPVVRVLGENALLPGRSALLGEDPELGAELRACDASLEARTLSGQLNVRPLGMDRWARLDRYGKALALACDGAVDRELVLEAPEASGLVVASQYSCLEVNATFDHALITKGPERASPLLFPYTLPGSTASEIAMLLRLMGPYMIFTGGAPAALAAFVAALDLLHSGAAARLVVAAADVLGPATLRSMAELGGTEPGAPVVSEAAAALFVGQPEPDVRGPLFIVEAALAGSLKTPESLARLVCEALDRAGVTPAHVRQVVTCTSNAALRRLEDASTLELMPQADLVHLPWKVGSCGAALGILALQAALESQGPQVVLANAAAGSVAMISSPLSPLT